MSSMTISSAIASPTGAPCGRGTRRNSCHSAGISRAARGAVLLRQSLRLRLLAILLDALGHSCTAAGFVRMIPPRTRWQQGSTVRARSNRARRDAPRDGLGLAASCAASSSGPRAAPRRQPERRERRLMLPPALPPFRPFLLPREKTKAPRGAGLSLCGPARIRTWDRRIMRRVRWPRCVTADRRFRCISRSDRLDGYEVVSARLGRLCPLLLPPGRWVGRRTRRGSRDPGGRRVARRCRSRRWNAGE